MTLCDHHIIANSSYRWWGAWLNTKDEKRVIAPASWFGPAIASGQLANFWIWILGPILGALAAVFLYDALVKPKK